MLDAIPHLGVLDGYYDPFGVFEYMSVLSGSGRESHISCSRLDRLAIRIGHKMPYVFLHAFLAVADLISIA